MEAPDIAQSASKACRALLAHIQKTEAATTGSGKQNLLADANAVAAETPIWLTLTTKKHIHKNACLQPAKIIVPTRLNSNEETVCIVVADPQRFYKNMVASDEFPSELRSRITRVIDITHLAKKFKSFEAQRKLASEHDVFLADTRIINRLPKLLGKTFFKSTRKRPVPVEFMRPRERGSDGKRIARPKGKKEKRDPAQDANARPVPEIVKEIEKALGSALVHLSPSTNTAIRIGYGDWTPDQVTGNAIKVVNDLVAKFVPEKWNNVRSIFVKGPNTIAVPVWQTDELWADQDLVVPDDQAPRKVLPGEKQSSEKANIGKKRKSMDADPEREARPKKKSKRAVESGDDTLDEKIAERKALLKKQKKAAKATLSA